MYREDAAGRDALERLRLTSESEILSRLRLSAAETARVCGVTPRQLIYWTRKGFLGAAGEDRDYDVVAMEKVIRIRRALSEGLSLENAARTAEQSLAAGVADVQRLAALDAEALEHELRERLARLETRVSELRQALPVSLSLARLRRAVAHLTRLEAAGALAAHPAGETARTIALGLDRAVEELESLLADAGAGSA